MTLVRVLYEANGKFGLLDYNPEEAGEVAEVMYTNGLGTSTVSLFLKLLSTIEELAMHQEHQFAIRSINWDTVDGHEGYGLDQLKVLDGIIRGLDRARREGAEEDKPEGSRYITMSDTLATQIADELNKIGMWILGDKYVREGEP